MTSAIDHAGNLFVALNAARSFPDVGPASRFLALALEDLPGVSAAAVVIGGDGKAAAECEGGRSLSIPMHSHAGGHGFCRLDLTDPGAFQPYRDLVRNAVALFALDLDYRAALEGEAHARAYLEDAVKRRTTELEETNERLVVALDREHRASRNKTDFLANLSHELRTPLNAILGFTETMRDGLFGPLGNPRYEEYSGIVHHSAHHLMAILNDVLDLSKIEAGSFDIQTVDVAVGRLVADTCALQRGQGRAAHVGVAIAPIDPDLIVRGDDRLLRQALANLLSNAIKYSGDGECVDVSAARTERGELELSVRDRGPGILPSDLDRVMRPFEQSSAPIRAQAAGTGLGLPLARSIARLHGGELEILPRDGGGLSAILRLPAVRVLHGGAAIA
ncbi:MAG: HAMP domain-containing sensor histidine kinase [Marivibrio sp.]|uniref:sensor histidine kinase n=1 Tax=Marivibrio sp. TaxID=2039719 RepID=UPI0032EF0C23